MSSVLANPAADFVRALALAWKNLAAYPRGHPALNGSLAQAQQRLDELRGPAGEVTFGVASDGLLYGKEKLWTEHAQKFAYVLYTNRVAVITFDFGVDADELEQFLCTLGVGTGATRSTKTAVWDELTAAGIKNIRLQPVDYSGVQMTDSLAAPLPEKRASLWDDILTALLAGRDIGGDAALAMKSADDLSALLAKNMSAEERQRVAAAIRNHIAASSGTHRQLAVQQVMHLLETLPEPMRAVVLRGALEALTSEDGAASLLRQLASAMSRDYVLEALRQLDQRKFAGHALDLLRSLGADVATPTSTPNLVRVEIDHELVTLFGDDDIDRFNPPDHQALLQDVSLRFPRIEATKSITDLGTRVETVAEDEVTMQLVDATFELLWRFGEWRPPEVLLARIESAFHRQIQNGRFNDALMTIERLREISSGRESRLADAASESLARLASPLIINDLLGSVAKAPERASQMHRVIQALGLAASRAVLVALSEEENRSRRRRLFDFAASLGGAIIADIPEFLHDSRWFVVRNMIMLVRALNDRTLIPEVRRCAHHPDLRVRLEAIKTLLAFDTGVTRALLDRAINDPDPKLAETAVALVGSYGIKEGVDPLLDIVANRDVFARRTSLRIRAIKSLGELAQPRALERMRHLFKDSWLPWPSMAERRAAYESLATYPPDARESLVARGLKSRDPFVREVCRRLARE